MLAVFVVALFAAVFFIAAVAGFVVTMVAFVLFCFRGFSVFRVRVFFRGLYAFFSIGRGLFFRGNQNVERQCECRYCEYINQ
jgi:hypothetical protein